MTEMENQRQIIDALCAALLVSPTAPHLLTDELKEVLRLGDAEAARALRRAASAHEIERSIGQHGWRLGRNAPHVFRFWASDDLRNEKAADALHESLGEHWANLGARVPFDPSSAQARFVTAGGMQQEFDVVVAIAEVLGMKQAEDPGSYKMTGQWQAWTGHRSSGLDFASHAKINGASAAS